VDGVLGGYGNVSTADIKESKLLLKSVLPVKQMAQEGYALDCGAGIGRISKGLLLPMFKKVDLVEVSEPLIETARKSLGNHKNIGDFYQEGLQHFQPAAEKYDCIWIQWVVGYLPDTDLVAFLIRCKAGLKASAVIVLKENVTRNDQYFLDNDDNNVIRSDSQFKALFPKAGLKLVKQRYQREFPRELFPVCMYVLKPDEDGSRSD
jgi:protein N-terminal methyltransferase